jgi:5-methylcytosine-specific restriction endonuclease McrA
MSDDTTPTKQCSKCKREFPATLGSFYKRISAKDGLMHECKDCSKQRARQWVKDNPERSKKSHREYYENNKEYIYQKSREYIAAHPEQNAEYKRRSHRKNKHKERSYQALYYQIPENRERRKALARQRYTNDPAKDLTRQHKRRLRILENGGAFNAEDIALIYKGQGGKCWYCSKSIEEKYHIDHFIPLAKGGSNDAGNLRLACPSCNHKKSSKHPHVFSGRLL